MPDLLNIRMSDAPAEKPRITRSVLTDESGRMLERSVQTGPKPAPWRNLTRDEDNATMAFPLAFLYPVDGSPIVPLRKIEIVVSTDRIFAASGEEAAVQVRGDIDGTVGVKINQDRYELDGDDMVLLSAEEAGIYQVALDDARYWSDRQSYIIAVLAQTA